MFLDRIFNRFAGRRPSPLRRPFAQLGIERLEDRVVMTTLSAGVLKVEGTRKDDDIRISQNGGTIWVETMYADGASV